jgi:uncharacterized Zn finger protein (UPF0148 family)
MGVRTTHGLRNAISIVALPATFGASSVGLKGEGYVCPTCGGPAVTKEVAARQTAKREKRDAEAARHPEKFEKQEKREAERRRQVDAGDWWLEMGRFRGQKPMKRTLYLGGWSAYSTIHTGRDGKTLILDSEGVRLQGAVKTLLAIPWPEIVSLSTEDAAVSERSRIVAEVVSKGHRKREKETVFVVRTTKGDEVLFMVAGVTSDEYQSTLAPLMKRMNADMVELDKSTAFSHRETTTKIVDELAKLAELRSSGALTDEEFAVAKARLLET